MKQITLVLGFVMLVTASAEGWAAGSESTAMLMGIGVRTCGQFAQAYGRDVAVEGDYFDWAQGYMSGMNTIWNINKGRTRDLRAISPEEQKIKLRDFCSQKPLSEYVTAATDLYMGLPLVAYSK